MSSRLPDPLRTLPVLLPYPGHGLPAQHPLGFNVAHGSDRLIPMTITLQFPRTTG